MPNVGFATLSVIPSMRGAQGALTGQMVGAGAAAGSAGGAAAGKTFTAKFAARAAKAGAIGKSMTKAVTLPLVAVGVAAIKSADNIDAAYDSIKIATGASGKKMQGLKGVFDSVAKSIPVPFDTIATTIGSLNTLTGATGPVLKKLTTDVLEASRVMGEDGAANAKLFGAALNAANIPASKADGVLKALYVAGQNYDISIGENLKNLKKFGPQMQSAGFSMKQTISLFGQFNKAGVSANRIVPSLNTAFLKWSKAGKDPAKMLASLSKKIKGAKTDQEAMTLASQDFSGPGAAAFVTALRKGGVQLDKRGLKLKTSGVDIEKIGKKTRTMGEKFATLGHNAAIALYPLGETLLPIVIGAVDKMISAVTKAHDIWVGLPGPVRKFIGVMAGVLAVVGPTLVVFAKLVAVGTKVSLAFKTIKGLALGTRIQLAALKVQTIATAAAQKIAGVAGKVFAVGMRAVGVAVRFAMGPVGLIIIGLAAAAAGLIYAYKHSETFRAIVNAAFSGVKKVVSGVLGWFTKSFIPFFTVKIPAAFQSVLSWVKKHWKTALFVLLTGPMGLATIYIKSHWDNITGKFKAAWSWVKTTFKAAWNGVKSILKTPIHDALVGIRTIWDNITDKFKSVRDWVKTTFKTSWAGVKSILTSPITSAKEAFHTLLGAGGKVRTIFSNAVSAIGRIWGKLENAAKKPVKFVIDTVLNKGLIDAFNWVSGKFGISAIPHIPLPKGFASGGWTGPGAKHKVAGTVHADEYVWSKDDVRAAGGHAMMDRWRAAVHGYAGGGRVWPLPGGTTSTYPGHDGLDFNAPNDFGKAFLAAAKGVISYVGWGRGYGDAIFERGPYGELVYGHSSNPLVHAGQQVSAGDVLGLVGSTGHSTGPHLHFGFPGGTSAQAQAFLAGADVSGGSPGGGGGFNPLAAFTGKLKGILGKLDGIKDSWFGRLVAAVPSAIVDAMKDKLGSLAPAARTGAKAGLAHSGPLGLIASKLFDDGGEARGAGYIPKRTIAPERVLSPRQSQAFESAMSNGFGNSDDVVSELRALRSDLSDLQITITGSGVMANEMSGLMNSATRRSVSRV